MIERRALLISNPKTGRYGMRRPPQLNTLCDYLRAQHVEVELVSTTGPGDATRIAESVREKGFNEVIVSGGDGTINEVLQGLIGTALRLVGKTTKNPCGDSWGFPTSVGQILLKEANEDYDGNYSKR